MNNNINPFFQNNNVNTQRTKNSGGYIGYGVGFGNRNMESDAYCVNKKKKSFWQKWKGWLLGGTAILSTAVLG